MKLESLVNLHNDLTKLNPNVPIVVTCERGILIYRQLKSIVMLSGIQGLFFCNKDIKLGIMTPDDFKLLMNNLETLIQDPALVDNKLETCIKDYGFEVYKLYHRDILYGPQIYLRFKLVTFKSSLITKFILRRFSPETETLLKSIKNEKRMRRKQK